MHSGLHVFEKFLEGYGYGIYSIDYTQDFSGVLDREALVGKLGFRKAGDFCTAIDEKELTILENTNTVGEHVCTWISTTAEGRTARTKIYNKVVSNSRQEKSANLLAAIWQTTPTAPTHTSAKPSYTRTCKPEGARASKSLCTHAHKTNFRARKPQTTSRKSWSKFPRKTRRTASSWSNPPANSGKTSPKAWIGVWFSQTDHEDTFLLVGTHTQGQEKFRGSTCTPPQRKCKTKQSGKKLSCGQQGTLASGIVQFFG